MKVSEFEYKLTTVSDAKLLQMLEAGRRDGPDVAVKLILAEGRRRGIEGMEEDIGKGTRAYAKGHDGAHGAGEVDGDAVPRAVASGDTAGFAEEAGAPAESESAVAVETVPAGSSKWLSEETSSSKAPALLKVLLYIAALGGLIFGALKFIQRG